MISKIKTVGIVGAGTMGLGIAQACAVSGFRTLIFDINKSLLDESIPAIDREINKGVDRGKISIDQKKEALSKIGVVNKLEDLKADLIIEAVVEDLEVKRNLFVQLEKQNPDSILASNTSSISITQIAKSLHNSSRCVGLHFFNPAHIMKLVEIISGAATSPEIVTAMKVLCKSLNKVAVVAKDSPGFIVNRVARHYYVEALQLLEEQIADVETIDTLLQSSGFKMGPFRLMDLIGVDTNFSVTTSMYNAFHQDPKFRPSRIQEQKVNAGLLGSKTGKGFYEYSEK